PFEAGTAQLAPLLRRERVGWVGGVLALGLAVALRGGGCLLGLSLWRLRLLCGLFLGGLLVGRGLLLVCRLPLGRRLLLGRHLLLAHVLLFLDHAACRLISRSTSIPRWRATVSPRARSALACPSRAVFSSWPVACWKRRLKSSCRERAMKSTSCGSSRSCTSTAFTAGWPPRASRTWS